MAYSADWIGKVITIPQSDLTLISGVNYSLDVADVHVEVNRMQSALDEGLWAPQVIEFYPTVTLSGIDKPPTVEFINDYTVEFGGSNYNVFLSGYDTNLIDVLTPGNGISVLGNNSVGKITSGSGVTEQDKTDIAAATLTAAQTTPIHSDVKKVTSIDITGVGTEADPWGP